jgi:hypothetical protein
MLCVGDLIIGILHEKHHLREKVRNLPGIGTPSEILATAWNMRWSEWAITCIDTSCNTFPWPLFQLRGRSKIKWSQEKRKISFGGGGQWNSVGPFVFFLEKKLQLKKKSLYFYLFFLKGYRDPGGIDKVHLALHEHILGTLWDIPRRTTISALYTW